MRHFVSVALLPLLLLACVGRSFDAARSEDTAAAYHRFLRDHPDSVYADEARQRMELVRLRSKPSVEAYDDFVKRWPGSPLLPELRAVVEEPLFERARAVGTAEAYRSFLADFERGALAERARGNLAWIESPPSPLDPQALAEFAERHPASDHAAEARRSAASLAQRSRTRFQSVGLSLRFSDSTPGRERLARVFSERAVESFRAVGVRVVPAGSEQAPPVTLVIQHDESDVGTRMAEGAISSGGVLARTTVSLLRRDGDADRVIFSRTTEFQAPGRSPMADTSVLFGPGTQPYWSSFFVPVATFETQAAVRPPFDLDGELVAVESDGGHAFALFRDGHFVVLDLSDPEQPWVFAEYERPRDLAKFDGLKLLGDRAVVFGQDGLEIVSLSGGAPQRLRALDRGAVGNVVAVEALEGGLALASQAGLFFLPDGGAPSLVLQRPIRGMARSGQRLVFSDGRKIYVSTLGLLRQGRVEGDLELGPGVRPGAIRTAGRWAVVLSDVGALRLDLGRPSEPRLVSRIDAAEVGALRDVALAGGRVFLLGERGLQVSDPRAVRVVESADVAARSGLGRMGRHLVMVGNGRLQVVDTTPFVLGGAAAPAAPGEAPEIGDL